MEWSVVLRWRFPLSDADTSGEIGPSCEAEAWRDGFLPCVSSMFGSLWGGSFRSSLMEVKESEAQGRCREAGSEGSVERKREPMTKNRIGGCCGRTSQQMMTKSSSIKDHGSQFGGCAWKIAGLTSGGLCRVEANACVRVSTESLSGILFMLSLYL